MVLEITIMVTFAGAWKLVTKRGHGENIWGVGNDLCLLLDAGYMRLIYKTSSSCTIVISAF